MKRVLLLSAGSPCRAIVAESILSKYIDKNLDIDFIGAGTEKNSKINENAIKILSEEGIDITKITSRVVEDIEDDDFDLILTICSHSKEVSPKFPRIIPTIHMEFSVIDDEDEAVCKALVERVKIKVKPIILKNIQ